MEPIRLWRDIKLINFESVLDDGKWLPIFIIA